jgi:hypothetical protein
LSIAWRNTLMNQLSAESKRPRLTPGRLFATPGALEVLRAANVSVGDC